MPLKSQCAFRLLFLIFPLAMMASAASAQTTSSPQIFACVSNLTGVVRIVAPSPGACHKGLESIVTWNQQGPAGPTGLTGSQGPAGVELPHVVLVPSVADAVANGNNLAAAIANITDASVANPYVVQLDAGRFQIPEITLPAYVSLRGALTGSTTILPAGQLPTCKINFPQPPSCTTPDSTLTLAGGNTLAELSIELVHVSLDASAGTYTLHDVDSTTSNVTFSITDGQSIRIENSTLKLLYGQNPSNLPSTDVVAIDSQIGSFGGDLYQTPGGGLGPRSVDGLHCLATFNNSYVQYSISCQ